jgi:hypothetical protein
MATKLFETNDRTTAHRHLAEVLAAGEFPFAECREYHNEESPYQVWSDAEPGRKENKQPEEAAAPAQPAPAMKITFSDEELFKIGEGMAIAQAKMKALGG